jgi:hypothetical protein
MCLCKLRVSGKDLIIIVTITFFGMGYRIILTIHDPIFIVKSKPLVLGTNS